MPNPALEPRPPDLVQRLYQRLAALEQYVQDLAANRPSNNPLNQQSWVSAALASPWGNGALTSSGEAVPGYFKDPSGIVHLRGTASHSTYGGGAVTIFTLPAGFRPGSRQLMFAMAQVSGAPGATSGFIIVQTSGAVQFSGAAGNLTDVILDNLHFRAEN